MIPAFLRRSKVDRDRSRDRSSNVADSLDLNIGRVGSEGGLDSVGNFGTNGGVETDNGSENGSENVVVGNTARGGGLGSPGRSISGSRNDSIPLNRRNERDQIIHDRRVQPSRPIPRSNSEDTLVESVDFEQMSLFTLGSQETAVTAPIKVFNLPISNFNQVKEFQIISTYLLPGVCIFKSKDHLQEYLTDQQSILPYLHLNTAWQSIFKKNSPIITIYKFTPQKTILCQVYNKILTNWISYYKIVFADDTPDIYLLNNNSYNPTVDFEVENTKFRISGIKGNSSMFGNNTLMKLYLMKPQAELLTNDMKLHGGKLILTNKLSTLINKQQRQQIQNMINVDLPAINLPLATFIESSEKLMGKFTKNGIIKMVTNNDEDYELILISILLILREQETKKFKGNIPNVN